MPYHRGLRSAMLLCAEVPLDQDTIVVIHVGLVSARQVFFERNQDTGSHDYNLPFHGKIWWPSTTITPAVEDGTGGSNTK